MSRFLLAIPRILWYAVPGAVSSTPVGGSPRSFSGVISSFAPFMIERGWRFMDVTWEGIFQFCLVIMAVITLVRQDNNKKR